MNYIPPGNSINQSDDNVSTSGTPIPFLVVFGSIVGLSLVILVLCGTPSKLLRSFHANEHSYMVKLRYHHGQPQRDVEAAKRKTKETVDLQTLNNANPSQNAICIEVLVDQDDVRRLKCNHVFVSTSRAGIDVALYAPLITLEALALSSQVFQILWIFLCDSPLITPMEPRNAAGVARLLG
ncbi:hypothetical protein FOXB_15818 [Fusarium oxysporum f. sp. conglutinans Fo5176]|uniref:Uncharacterized protein n=1 Tax=Fusarium oxysporum (strain Fo5176) TaxID=660025 RepID=F9GAY5_FUSOF|nr:hypothetical protein FOXB_15818 [Fusarium oxysporum f. sp. conglutinans Fo5176]